MELEVLLSRQGSHMPDELRVLQAENCHFRDLTFARLAEVEYWKKLYTAERNANAEKLAALRAEYERRIEEELAKYKAALDNSGEIDALHAKYAKAISEQFDALKRAHEAQLMELDGARQALIIEHEIKLQALKDSLDQTIKSELTEMAKKHAQEIYQLEMDYNELRKKYNADMKAVGLADREKLESVIKILKQKDEESQAIQQELINRLNMTKSQTITGHSNDQLIKENAELHQRIRDLQSLYDEIEVERQGMFNFVSELIRDGIVDKEKAKTAKARFLAKFGEESPRREQLKALLGKTGLANAVSNNFFNGFKLDGNLESLPKPHQEVHSPTFLKPTSSVKEFDNADQIAEYVTLGKEVSLGGRSMVIEPKVSQVHRRESLVKDLNKFEENAFEVTEGYD